jgi:hypothetical protein
VSSEATDTERALEEALRERARLWEQLHEQRAAEREVEHLRAKVAMMESSLSWRITSPLRVAKTYWHKLKRLLNSRD